MATYKGIKGYNVQALGSDPPAVAANEGQVWFNTASQLMKGVDNLGAGTWSTGGVINVAGYGVASGGKTSAGIIVGGAPGAPRETDTETYDGTTWTEANNVPGEGVYGTGMGTQTAMLYGAFSPATAGPDFLWDGTSWAASPAFNTTRYGSAGGGISTDAILAAGWAPGIPTNSEEWNGTAWSEGADVNQGRSQIQGGGTSSTSSIIAGGRIPIPPDNSANTTKSEEWNGTSWAEGNDCDARDEGGGSGASGTDALLYGGRIGIWPAPSPSAPGVCLQWNGTSWTAVGSITGRGATNKGGTVAVGMFCAGGDPASDLCEEYAAGFQVAAFTTD